jgi:hypothetical protein
MNRPEEITHRAIAAHLRLRLAPPWMFWSTPNQRGTRKGWEQAILAALGVRPGIPDLFVAGEGRVIGVEVKASKGSLSPAQRDTIAALAAAGIPTVIVRSVDEAEAVLRQMGVPLRGRLL